MHQPEVVLRLWWDTPRMERLPGALQVLMVLADPCWVSRWVKNSRGDTVGWWGALPGGYGDVNEFLCVFKGFDRLAKQRW